jgi:hypothetical protein
MQRIQPSILQVPSGQSLAAPAGLEPAPLWLTASRTTVVLRGKIVSQDGRI